MYFFKLKVRKLLEILVNVCSRSLKYLFRNEFSILIVLNPKFSNSLVKKIEKISSDNDFVLLLQGPINNSVELDYLVETLKVYRNIFQDLKIVISSYYSCEKYLNSISMDLYDTLVLNDESGLKSNFEKQVLSSYKGVVASGDFNRKFVVKSRVDQRFINPNSFTYFSVLLDKFPSRSVNKNSRIIGSSCNSWLYRPLGISDMLIIGTFENQMEYWKFDKSVTNYSLENHVLNYQSTWLSKTDLHFESFLAARFLAINGFVFSNDPMNDNNKMWRDYMMVVNAHEIEHFWRKRNSLLVGNAFVKFGYNANPNALKEINFIDWLTIYSGFYEVAKIDSVENI